MTTTQTAQSTSYVSSFFSQRTFCKLQHYFWGIFVVHVGVIQVKQQLLKVLPVTWFYVCVGIVRASSVFPILSTILLLLGGLCVGVGRVYSKRNNILLSAGILFVAAGKKAHTVLKHTVKFYSNQYMIFLRLIFLRLTSTKDFL